MFKICLGAEKTEYVSYSNRNQSAVLAQQPLRLSSLNLWIYIIDLRTKKTYNNQPKI